LFWVGGSGDDAVYKRDGEVFDASLNEWQLTSLSHTGRTGPIAVSVEEGILLMVISFDAGNGAHKFGTHIRK
jgi:hypothetical protein